VVWLRTAESIHALYSPRFYGGGSCGDPCEFINNIADLSACTIEHNLDGVVINGRSCMLKSSKKLSTLFEIVETLALIGWEVLGNVIGRQ